MTKLDPKEAILGLAQRPIARQHLQYDVFISGQHNPLYPRLYQAEITRLIDELVAEGQLEIVDGVVRRRAAIERQGTLF